MYNTSFSIIKTNCSSGTCYSHQIQTATGSRVQKRAAKSKQSKASATALAIVVKRVTVERVVTCCYRTSSL